jgi:hypothetical protein
LCEMARHCTILHDFLLGCFRIAPQAAEKRHSCCPVPDDARVDLAFAGHGKASVGLRSNPERLCQEASAVVGPDCIADLHNLLRRERPTDLSEGRVIDVPVMGHLFDLAERGALLVIKGPRAPPVRDFSDLLVAVATQFHQRCMLV